MTDYQEYNVAMALIATLALALLLACTMRSCAPSQKELLAANYKAGIYADEMADWSEAKK